METTKRCTKCKEVKPKEEFYNHKHRKDGKNNSCITCKKIYNLANKERDLIRGRKYHSINAPHRNAQARKYKKENKGLINGINSLRYASKISTTPKWLSREDKKIIKYIYIMASIWSTLVKAKYNVNIKYTVDHIIPLKGKSVSGLHVPWNLQILPASINYSKGNKVY